MAKIVFDDGKEFVLSKEFVERLKKELLPGNFDKHVESIRVSSTYSSNHKGRYWPIRISILGDTKQGLKNGCFGQAHSEVDGLPGYTLSVDGAERLVEILNECIEFERNRE